MSEHPVLKSTCCIQILSIAILHPNKCMSVQLKIHSHHYFLFWYLRFHLFSRFTPFTDVCPLGFVYQNGFSCYAILDEEFPSKSDAAHVCASKDARLASIETEEELALIVDLIDRSKNGTVFSLRPYLINRILRAIIWRLNPISKIRKMTDTKPPKYI